LLLSRSSGAGTLNLDDSLLMGAGGEARVYVLPDDPSLVAKVYHEPSAERSRKLEVMVANPPLDPMLSQGHVSIAWPIDLLCASPRGGDVVGFLMPRVQGMAPAMTYYNPGTRRKECPLFSYLYLHRAARNVVAAVRAVHSRGYVIGDINESNLMVADNALVTLVDTDSFQVTDPHGGAVYRSPVGKPEFTPPELQGVRFSDVNRLPEHDLFGLAVLIFRFLMEGTHPFSGVYTGSGDPPSYEQNILAGHFAYGGKRPGPNRPIPIAPPMEIIDPTVRELLVRCFDDGFDNPRARPDCPTWQAALGAAEDSLTSCAVNPQHRYGRHLSSCPWCQRAALLGGRDPFPSPAQLAAERKAARPPEVPQTPAPAQQAASAAVAAQPQPAAPPRPQRAATAGRARPSTRPPLRPFRAAALLIDRVWSALLAWEQVLALIAIAFFTLAFFDQGEAVGVTALLVLVVIVVAESAFRANCRRTLRLAATGAEVKAMEFAPQSDRLAGTDGASVVVWDLRTGRGVWLRGGTESARLSLAFSPSEDLLAAGSMDGVITLWDAHTRAPLEAIAARRGSAVAVAFSPDGQALASGYTEGTMVIWSVDNREPMASVPTSGHRITAIACSADARTIVSSGTLGKVVLWDHGPGGHTLTFQGPATGVNDVAFSASGLYVAGGGMDRLVYLWDAHQVAAPRKLSGHPDPVYCVAFSPDGELLASGDLRGHVFVWNTRTGQRYHRLRGQGACVRALAFAEDGSTLRVACTDGTVCFWALK